MINVCQRGFREGLSIYTNLVDICEFTRKAKEVALAQRRNKVRLQQRECHYLVFLDLEKAFDSVERQLLLTKLSRFNVGSDLLKAVAGALTNTSHYYPGEDRMYTT